ncbi:MAG TPA: hypothetical protein VKS21_12295, partial [Spirochaetota bacterium]|nr:hypothetical protein [Spirochaetota bacterium]
MLYKKPEKIKDIFSVFFTVTQTNCLKLTFIFLLILAAVNLGLVYLTSRLIYPGIGIALLVFIDIYLLTAFQTVISANLDIYISKQKSISFTDLKDLLNNKSFYLLAHPFLLLLFIVVSFLLVSLDSIILNIPVAGPFIYSITFIVFFLFGIFFIVNILLAAASMQLYPSLLAEREIKLTDLYKELGKIFYYSWPRLILANIIQLLLTLFFTLVSIAMTVAVFFLIIKLTAYFRDFSADNELIYLFNSFPGGESIISFLAAKTGMSIFSNYHVAYLPPSYRIAGF